MAKPLQKLVLSALFFLSIFSVQAQERCGTMAKHEHLLETDKAYKEYHLKSEELALKQRSERQAGVQGVVYKVPVVVHILHNGEALGVGPNITTDQVHSAISSLNNAYRKKAGTIYAGNGVDVEIEFCLAQRDPSGNPSTGIVRVNAGLSVATYATQGITDPNEVAVKAISKWDNTRYYNIWVVSEIDNNGAGGGVQGYAYFAGAGPSVDGTVILFNAFGYDPEGNRGYNLKSFTNKNITTIHELGHAFSLYHTFEGDGTGSTCPTNTNCVTQGDRVCDTPPHIRSSSNCVTGVNGCDGNSSRELFIHNFMEYSSDDCQTEFTAGQSTRARSILTSGRSNLITSANLIACGCNSNTAPIARFYTVDKQPCDGIAINFIDESINFPATYSWTFQGGTPATSNSQNPSVSFSGAGPYNVSLTVTASGGQNNSTTKTAYINPQPGYSGSFPFTESFEGTFPPTNWKVSSSDASSTWGADGTKQWEKRTVGGSGAGTAAAAINLWNYPNAGRVDDLVMPSLNLTGQTTASMTFKVAHKYYDANGGAEDTLIVLASTNCGATFTQLYKKGSPQFASANSIANFTPSLTTDWITETIDLTAFAGQNVQLRFRTVNGYGSNVYIDDVNVSVTTTPPVANFSASKTSNVQVSESITFTNTSTGGITSYSWNFGAGATPATATGIGPHNVSYTTAGTKTVSLTVTGPGGSDIETKTNFITVIPPPDADFIASKTSDVQLSESITFTNTSSGNIATYSWNFGVGASPATASGVGPHSVIYTSAGTKTVSLTVTGLGGSNTETKSSYITVIPVPIANFTASKTNNVLQAEQIIFTNTSSGTINSYSWNFGTDASPASAVGEGPHSVSYSSVGVKTVVLSVTGPGGTDVETKINYVTVIDPAAAPIADFTASKTTAIQIAEGIIFTDASNGTVTSYSWDFGSGATPATATGIGPHSVSYSTSGLKTVSLSLTGPGGDDTETKTDFIDVSIPSSIQSAESLGIKIYPNPTKDMVYVDLQDQEEVSVEVMSTTVNQVLKTQKGRGKITIDLSGQPQGLYVIMVKTNKGNVVSRVAKTN